jgi:hypothetical protein
MGFEIFVGAFHKGESSTFSFDLVENAFASAITNRMEIRDGSFSWTIEYELEHPENVPSTIVINGVEHPVLSGDCGEIYISLKDPTRRLTGGFMVTGIPMNLAFYQSLLTVLQATHTALYWPGKNSLVIGREDMIEHLPQDMSDVLGEPFLVTRAEQIIERLDASW